MKVSAITNRCPKPCFTSEKQEYENPVNRKTERNLTVLQASGVSLIAGVTAGGIASCLIKEGAKHKVPISVAAGAAVGILTAVLTLPAKLYDRSVKSFVREDYEIEKMKKEKIIDEKTILVINHFSHNGKCNYDKLQEICKKYNIIVSYDGLEIEF